MRTRPSVPMRGAAIAVALFSTSAVAQLPNASTAAFGMGGNFTAIARGYEAIRWNPANLAMPGRPLISLGIGIGGGNTGTEPIDLSTMHKFSGSDVDSATRVSWIEAARLAGGQRGRLDGGLTPIALSVGPIGFHAGASFYSSMNLSPDAWEAFLFGNAGNNGGQPKTLDLTGTSLRFGAISAAGASIALPIPINFTNGLLKNERAAIGITGKYVLGNALIIADDAGSSFGASDLTFALPIIRPNEDDYDGMIGTGTGMDIGLSWSGGPWRIGALVENVFNNFAWDTTKLAFTPGTGTVNQDTSFVNFDETVPYSAAPAAMKQIVTDQVFKPGISVGASLALSKSLTLTADVKQYTGGEEAIVFGPKSHFGVGAEWRVLPFIPLRAGVASVTDGWQAGAGAGLRLLGYEFGLATSVRRRGQAMESGLMFGVIGIGR
jgi:hypothetical protein